MPFNYSGHDTYKTAPGGCLTILTIFLVVSYLLLKIKHMTYREEWKLVQIDKETLREELLTPLNFSGNQNITMGVQFTKRPTKFTKEHFYALKGKTSNGGEDYMYNKNLTNMTIIDSMYYGNKSEHVRL